ncbi:MAG: hypothetical protein Kow00123_20290 [Anaerolineales bacterium]
MGLSCSFAKVCAIWRPSGCHGGPIVSQRAVVGKRGAFLWFAFIGGDSRASPFRLAANGMAVL